MTGYGTSDGPAGGGRLSVEIRTVNHRHFSMQFRLPQDLQPFENDLKGRLREQFERGHATVVARWAEDPVSTGAVQVDVERGRAVVDALQRLKGELGLDGTIDLGFVARQPGVLSYGEAVEREIDLSDVLAVLDQTAAAVQSMRQREGEALAAELEKRLRGLEERLEEVVARAPQRLEAERERLRNSVADLLDGRALDESRLSQEIALLADKLDITEEIVRLRTHLGAFREGLAGTAAVGKQLSFLGQEMLREVNTIGSKANDATIAQAVIGMKGDLEKIREQVENIE